MFKNNVSNKTPPVAASSQSTLTKIQNILSCSLPEFAVHNPKSRDVFHHGVKSMVLYCLFSIQGALRKRQLIIISQSTLTESHEKYLFFIFQSHITKFDQKKVFHTFFLACLPICTILYERGNQFLLSVKRSNKHHENTICMNFQSSNPKFSQES